MGYSDHQCMSVCSSLSLSVFGDEITTHKIMLAQTPADCKYLGSRVENFKLDEWKAEAKGIMKAGLRCKFSQNPKCFKALELTGEHTLVEASPHDFLWGAGLLLNDANLANATLWKGKNWMGNVLEDIRTELITGKCILNNSKHNVMNYILSKYIFTTL